MRSLPDTHQEILELEDGDYRHTEFLDIHLRIEGDSWRWHRGEEFLANYEQVSLFKLPKFLERLKRSSVEVALTTNKFVDSNVATLQIPEENLEFNSQGQKMADIADLLLDQSKILLERNKGIEAQDIIHKDIEMAVKLLDHAHKNYRKRKKL
jgi:hypothetical protein